MPTDPSIQEHPHYQAMREYVCQFYGLENDDVLIKALLDREDQMLLDVMIKGSVTIEQGFINGFREGAAKISHGNVRKINADFRVDIAKELEAAGRRLIDEHDKLQAIDSMPDPPVKCDHRNAQIGGPDRRYRMCCPDCGRSWDDNHESPPSNAYILEPDNIGANGMPNLPHGLED